MAERKITKILVLGEDESLTGKIQFKLGKDADGNERVIEFDRESVPVDTRFRAEMHGYSQKIGDSYAGAGKAADPIAAAEAAINETIAQLYAGDWKATSGGGPKISDLAVALARVTGESEEEAQALVDAMSDEDKKVYRNKGRVKVELNKIRLARLEESLARAKKATAAEPTDDEEVVLPKKADQEDETAE